MVESAPIESHAESDASFEYQSVEHWAVASLLIGLLSPVALVAPVMWFVPILGWLSGGVALAKIRSGPGRPGRVLVLVGLALSTFFLVVPAARMVSARILLAGQPRPVADKFLEYLQERSPEKALTLQWVPDYRHGVGDNLWLFFRSDADADADLRKFVSQPMIRMLLALGKDAQVRYYKTALVGMSGDLAQVEYWYSITFTDEDDQKKTYFIGILLERKPTRDPNLNPWRVRNFGGGFKPV